MRIKITYPDVVLNIKDIKTSIDAGDKVGNVLESHVQEMINNITIKESELSGIEHRERVLGIKPLDTATLEERRLEVLIRWYDMPLYTERVLRQKLDAVLGEGNYTLEIDLDKKTVSCLTGLTSQKMIKSIGDMLEQMVPLDYLFKVILHRESYVYQYVAVKTIAGEKVVLHDNGKDVINVGHSRLYQHVAVKNVAEISFRLYDNGKEAQENA